MKKRSVTSLQLDSNTVESYKQDVQSYQINNDATLQLRAFLLTDGGFYTRDGRQLAGNVKKEDIDPTFERTVGRGASGEVACSRLKNGMIVALKRIPISSKTHRDEVDRELQFFSSRGDCPFVMKNFGAFWDPEDGAIVIPMEWMAYTVKDLGEFWQGIEESILRDIFFQVVSGLMYLHDEKRVIHRDLKPSNLLVNESGYVKIADFGVSKLVQTLDVSSTYVGTMFFMAPERLENGSYSFSCDVWSLGLTMIATVTGNNPWAPPNNMNLFQILSKISGDTIPTLPEKPNYSQKARDFVAKCLIRDPDERPTCAELLTHPFFEGVTQESAVANVKMGVEYMTRLINNDAKKNNSLKRSQDSIEKDVNAKLDKLVS